MPHCGASSAARDSQQVLSVCCNHNEPHNLDPCTPVQEQSTAMNWPAAFQEKQTGVVQAIIELGAMQC